MTLDLWTDDFRKIPYLTITLHYIDRDWSRTHERVLCTSQFDMEKTGENILCEVSWCEFECKVHNFCFYEI